MKKATTLIKEIDRAAETLVKNYSQEEINKAFDELLYENPYKCSNYIASNIYVPEEE